ncbi:hypothetical protein SUGI_1158890 [Cryptomeria japonica]|nr:hypothetical protein SUGI_1158890 [Cryptomeria japonica]
MGESQISIGKANVRLCASQWKKTHRSRGSCKSRRNENLQSAVGRKIWLGRDLPIESNIWRDRMHYGFKLHSCRLGFSFANDRLPLEHGQGAIRVSILPLLHSTGYVSQSCFCPSTISGLLLHSPLTLFRDTLITPGFAFDHAPELALVHSSLTQVPWFDSCPVNMLIDIIQRICACLA